MKFKKVLTKRSRIRLLFFITFFLFSSSFVFSSNLSIDAPATLYNGCVQPYLIKLDTMGTSTKSIDVKMFLTGYFGIQNPYVEINDALLDGQSYANYLDGDFDSTNLYTGVASSGGIYFGWPYLYINSFQIGGVLGNDISGNSVSAAILYLKANNFNTGKLDFYYINGWNGDDSNVSSGLNAGSVGGTYVVYSDSLNSVSNLEKTISLDSSCSSKPYIHSSFYRQTGYVSTSTGVQAVWTSVVAGPIHSGTINRTIWTKGDVKLSLTGFSDDYVGPGGLVQNGISTGIQLKNVSVFNHDYISPINFTIGQTGWNKQYYEILITGNISTGFVGFDNILGNTGSTYLTGGQKYTNDFNIDVFWIDTVGPVNTGYFTGYVSSTGVGFTSYILSGYNFEGHISNPIDGFHAIWTDMDDQYKVIGFSGINTITQNCIDLGYPCTSIGYMQYLNTTGYVWSGNNTFKLEHNILFTNSFSGYVIMVDRAGNTGEWYVEIDMDDLLEVNYGIIAYTESAGSRVTNSLSGMLLKLAIYSGGFNKERLLGSGGAGIELIYTGWIKTSSTGWSNFTGNFASGQYWVLAEGVNTLSYLISGVNLSPIGGIIDFSIDYPSGFGFGDLNNILTQGSIKYSNYNASSIREQIINVSDLATLITIWAPWNPANYESGTPEIGVYTGSLFVDIPNGNRISVYNNLLLAPVPEQYMQYHPYDIDANGQVNVNDYNILFANLSLMGVTYGGRLNGPVSTNATMPF